MYTLSVVERTAFLCVSWSGVSGRWDEGTFSGLLPPPCLVCGHIFDWKERSTPCATNLGDLVGVIDGYLAGKLV